MSEWKEYKLGQVAEIQTGPFGSLLHQSDYKTTGTPIITVEHLAENKILHGDIPLVGDKDRKRLCKYVLQEGDIVFSRVGSVDRRGYVGKAEDGWMYSGRCLRVRSKISLVEPRFLSFYFGQESFKEHIRMIAVGATMPSINTDILSNVVIEIPGLPEQRAIAAVLSSLDDKIDLLHRQNKTLEAMAETVWRHWFEEGMSEGDPTAKVGDLVTVKGGTTPSTKNPEFWDGDIHWTSPRDLSNHDSVFLLDTEKKISEKGLAQIGSGLLPPGTVLLSSRAPIGYLAIAGVPLAINQGYIAIVCDKSVSSYFIYFWVKRNLDAITNAAHGSVFPEIPKSTFRGLDVAVPDASRLCKFDGFVEPLFQKIRSNGCQIQALAKMRDRLLPKLMSGEARVELTS